MPTDKDTINSFREAYQAFNKDRVTPAQVKRLFDTLVGAVQRLKRDLNAKIDARLAEIKDGKDGKDGRDGRDGKDGARGPKGDKGDSIVGPQGRAGRDGKDGTNGADADTEAIEGKLEDFENRLNATKPGNGIFIGPSRGVFLYIDGVKKGLINNMNLKAGTGVSLAYSKVRGQDTITVNASGGGAGGVTVETPPETPDASTTVFTVTAEPKYVVADGTTYFAGAGYSYSSLAVTMDIPPSASIRAII